jgi:uncharacterized delta-60 repeat protein
MNKTYNWVATSSRALIHIPRLRRQMTKLLMSPFIVMILVVSVFGDKVWAADGSLDSSFGIGGKISTDFSQTVDVVNDMAVQPDGKIVVAGRAGINFALARYNANGSLDTSFGTGGKVVTTFNSNFNQANAVAILSDGKIIAAGYTQDSSGFYDLALARYNSDGSLDTTFDFDGKVITDFNYGPGSGQERAEAIVIQPDGKIVVAGHMIYNFSISLRVFALARYNTDGSLDTSFGSGGKVVTYGGGSCANSSSAAYDVALQSDGKIVISGFAIVGCPAAVSFALVRYDQNGKLDTNFD